MCCEKTWLNPIDPRRSRNLASRSLRGSVAGLADKRTTTRLKAMGCGCVTRRTEEIDFGVNLRQALGEQVDNLPTRKFGLHPVLPLRSSRKRRSGILVHLLDFDACLSAAPSETLQCSVVAGKGWIDNDICAMKAGTLT